MVDGGALDWLTSPTAESLLAAATVHVVPNMNPMARGAGICAPMRRGNLNREWHEPTPERSPEVLCVRNRMDQTGVDFAIDAHGDEAIRRTSLPGSRGFQLDRGTWREIL